MVRVKPGTHDLDIYKGDSFELFFRIRETDVNGDPAGYVNLTGRVPKAQIRASASSGTVLAEFTAALADQTTAPGGVLLTLTPAQTAALTNGVWDVQLTTTATGDTKTYLRGTVTVTDEVTRT